MAETDIGLPSYTRMERRCEPNPWQNRAGKGKSPVAPIHFYFDFISPFGYFAALRVDDLARRHGRETEWHAMLLGVSVLKVMGLRPILETPLKGPYQHHDALRYARRHGVKFGRPPDAPAMNPLPAGRAFHWLKRQYPAAYKAVALDLLHAYWRDAVDISEPERIAAIAARHGLDHGMVLTGIAGDEARDLLRAAVDDSLAKGVFGSPFFILDGEPFWGAEKIEVLEEWLKTGGW